MKAMKAEISTMRYLARDYYALPRPVLHAHELAVRLWRKDRVSVDECTSQTTPEKVEIVCAQEFERAFGSHNENLSEEAVA